MQTFGGLRWEMDARVHSSHPARAARWPIVAALIAVPILMPAGETGAVTLEDAVRAALQTNPDVGVVSENRRAVEAELNQARAGFLPSIDVRGAAGEEFTNDPGTRKKARSSGDSRSTWLPRYESGISLRQMIYDGQETSLEVERQEARTISASRRIRETSELIALDAIEAYLDALRQRELTEIAEENVRIHEETLALVETRARGGAATVADVQQVVARLATAQDQLTNAEARLRDADATYLRVVGESPLDLVRPVVPLDAVPVSLSRTIEISLRNNPTIAVSRADVEAARKEYLASKAPFLPRFDFELDANSNRNVDGERGQDSSVSALVVMRYNLFRGGRDVNRRQELISRLAEARQRLNRSVRLVEEQARLSWNGLASARQRVEVLEREVAANLQVTITYRQQYDIGTRQILDLLDADRDYYLSRTTLTTVEFVEYFSAYRILADGGILLSALNVADLQGAINERDPVSPVSVDELNPADRSEADPEQGLPATVLPAPTLAPAPAPEPAPEPEQEVPPPDPDEAMLLDEQPGDPIVPAVGPPLTRPLRPARIEPLELRIRTDNDMIDPVDSDTSFTPPGATDDLVAIREEALATAAGPGDPAPETDPTDATAPAVLALPPVLVPPATVGEPDEPAAEFPDFEDPLLQAIDETAIRP